MELEHVMLTILGCVALACLILNPLVFIAGAVPAVAAIFLGGDGILPARISEPMFYAGSAVAFAGPVVLWCFN